MDFQIHQSVDDVNAFAFQLSCPFDVALFVEAGFQFDQDCDLLAVVDGFEEGFDDGRVAADAVERDLDGEHGGVARGFLQKGDYRLEGLEGMVEQHVLAADGGEDVVSFVLRLKGGEWRGRRACP